MSTPSASQQSEGTARWPEVSLRPPGPDWHALLSARHAATAGDHQTRTFRLELGLPAGSPVVMSGHQAQWWHAGILAKQAAMAAICRAAGASPAWVVVDQDASESLVLTYPSRARDGAVPAKTTWAVAPSVLADHVRADVALHDLPAFEASTPPTDAATPDAGRGLRAIADSAGRWHHSPTAAEQIARANAELVSAALGEGWRPNLVFATALLKTTAGRSVLERMTEDPRACVEAYNRAVADAGVRTIAPLSCVPERGRYELPLWGLSTRRDQPAPRRRIFAATLGETPLQTLAPRGIMMTALLRWLGCDLFIHGTGGGASGEEGGYDKVAERWLRLWLGVDLAPSVVATATALLPMGLQPTLSEEDLRTAHRRLENARHAPGSLGDAAAQNAKDKLVAAIAASTDRRERHRLYRELQQLLDGYRASHTTGLAALQDHAARTRGELAAQAVLRDRTWPWPLLPRTMVLELQRRVDALLSR